MDPSKRDCSKFYKFHGIMGIQQRIAWCFDERSKCLSGMESCSGSWPKNGVGKRISKAHSHWKEIEKASEHMNQDVETQLREKAIMGIEKRSKGMPEKRSKGMPEKNRGLIRIKRL